MARHPGRTLLTRLAATLLVASSGCFEQKPAPPSPSAPTSPIATTNNNDLDGGSPLWPGVSVEQRLRGLSAEGSAEGTAASAKWFFPVFDEGLFESAGKVDLENRYSSTVMVAADEPFFEMRCSGVLLAPRLVLTAAHCMCMGRKATRPGGMEGTLMDNSRCARNATVTTVLYEHGAARNEPDMQFETRRGQVHLHPGFEIFLDAQESVVSSHADLAVILLDEPVKTRVSYVSLANTESQAHESLVMVGYGNDKRLGGLYGMRYFRKNEVTRSRGDGRFLYEQQGAFVYNGFNGGPCFREQGNDRWLAGIAILGSDKELSFTSTYFYRAWLQTELQQADSARLPLPPHDPP
jgi:hypothetical protein